MTRTCTYVDPHNIQRCTECGITTDLCLCMNVEGFAHDRLHSPDGIVMTLVRGELDAARGKFPDSTHQLAALMEEVGELAQALMEHDRDGAQTIAMVLREAVQVASMAIRLATEGDNNFKYVFPATEEDLPRGPVTDRF